MSDRETSDADKVGDLPDDLFGEPEVVDHSNGGRDHDEDLGPLRVRLDEWFLSEQGGEISIQGANHSPDNHAVPVREGGLSDVSENELGYLVGERGAPESKEERHKRCADNGDGGRREPENDDAGVGEEGEETEKWRED